MNYYSFFLIFSASIVCRDPFSYPVHKEAHKTHAVSAKFNESEQSVYFDIKDCGDLQIITQEKSPSTFES